MRTLLRRRFGRMFRGQYMVEFGMTFVFFIFIVLAVVNMILVAYNFNLGQRASWEAARLAAVGQTNAQVANVIYDQFVTQFFASPFLISQIEFDSTTFIRPNNIFDRVEGEEVVVDMSYRVGFQLFHNTGGIYTDFPITNKLIVIARNDNDRDGLYDTTTANVKADSRTNDHDNDGFNDRTVDLDHDNDSRPNAIDTGILIWNGAAYTLDTGAGPRQTSRLNTGVFIARVIHRLSNGSYDSGPYLLRQQVIPRPPSGFFPQSALPVILDLSYDRNNNGWEDRYDR